MRISELEQAIRFEDIEKQIESKTVRTKNCDEINLADIWNIFILEIVNHKLTKFKPGEIYDFIKYKLINFPEKYYYSDPYSQACLSVANLEKSVEHSEYIFDIYLSLIKFYKNDFKTLNFIFSKLKKQLKHFHKTTKANNSSVTDCDKLSETAVNCIIYMLENIPDIKCISYTDLSRIKI